MEFLKSRKFIVMVVACVATLINGYFGKPIDDETMLKFLAIVGAYIIGQGVADHGSQGAATAALRAAKQGVDAASIVQKVLGNQGGADAPHVHDDDPNWKDTSEQDEEDKEANKPKQLNG